MELNDPDRLPPGAHEPCVDIVETITDYLEGALAPPQMRRIDEHLSVCDGCRTILDQWRTVIELAGHVTTEDVESIELSTREQLLASFRTEHAS